MENVIEKWSIMKGQNWCDIIAAEEAERMKRLVDKLRIITYKEEGKSNREVSRIMGSYNFV